jgi:hypothetical protein
MLTLLRKIRRSLIKSGSTKSYLFYAIGEIALVVIGILIALQINTWNEERKMAKAEAYALSEIVRNLKEDSEQINVVVERRKSLEKSSQILIPLLTQGHNLKDGHSTHISSMLTFERFYPLSNAYEMMKSNGTNIKNDKLRSQISRYYDFEQEKINKSVKDIEDVVIRIFNSNNAIRTNIKHSTSGAGLESDIRFKDINDRQFRQYLLTELILFRDNNTATLQKSKDFLKLNKALLQQVTKEIDTPRLKKHLQQP